MKYLDTAYLHSKSTKDDVNTYVFKVIGEFNTQFRYREFPLDSQELEINMNMVKPPEEVRVPHYRSSVDAKNNRVENDGSLFGWEAEENYYTIERTVIGSTTYEDGGADNSNYIFQSISLRIPIKRLLLKPLI